ncbi:uncharacterized protein LOC106993690 [Macaca mulatta]
MEEQLPRAKSPGAADAGPEPAVLARLHGKSQMPPPGLVSPQPPRPSLPPAEPTPLQEAWEAFTHPRSVVAAVTEACWSQNNVRLLCYIPELILRAWGLENARQAAAAAAGLGWREGGGVRVRRRWRLGGQQPRQGRAGPSAGSRLRKRGTPVPASAPPQPTPPSHGGEGGRGPRACELRILRLPAAAGLGASKGAGRERGYAGTPGGPLPPPLAFSLQAALPQQSAGRPRPGSPLPAPAAFEKTRPFPRASRGFRPRCAPLFAPLLALRSRRPTPAPSSSTASSSAPTPVSRLPSSTIPFGYGSSQ